MTPEQINIAIAEHLGLDVCREPDPTGGRWNKAFFTPDAAAIRRKNWPNSASVRTVPNYCGDLNAMHEAEKSLSDMIDYYGELEGVCNFTLPICATAAQRAEAFLRTVGKWPA